ncbi:response regulator transcription factor [Pseudoalteromonas sp. N1230-9]|jgi:DNA-binding response OmpR family regulator|uniref:response regulator transcription factor n=1 Tax=unclassified Pseudoalteromonas TaxID=194690 RepID=UPI0010230A34|nr:response regulator transcription factor [Pseudoalteromonas sp. CO302Y]RZG11445.1 response regulator transcription factor [Pseudoalteromonas sp. CO133X]WOC25522.1 response regulator transcription factor [Pseudoalteromonas sp. N1230-9]
MMQHIFLIEDDIKLASLIQKFLLKHGYTIDVFNTAQAYHNGEITFLPSLIICDIMLPDGNGFELITQLKEKYSCPVIFLTALDSVQSQIKGLDLGAYDYLIKPIKPELLLAKIKTIIAHTVGQSDNSDTHGPLRIDNLKKDIYFQCTALNLNESEFEIIAYLAKNSPLPVSREILFKHVIGREYDGLDRAIDLKISRLRKKLKDTINQHSNSLDIKSVRGKGYSLDIT